MVITSERHRTQTQNLADAWDKLYQAIKNVIEIPGETSMASLDRIERLYWPLLKILTIEYNKTNQMCGLGRRTEVRKRQRGVEEEEG